MNRIVKRFPPLLLVLLAGCATHQAPSRPETPVKEETHVVPAHEPAQALVAPSVPTREATSPPAGESTLPSVPDAPVKEPVSTRQAFADWNDGKLLDIYKGMTKKQVEQVMAPNQADKRRNPYKRQVLRSNDGKVYEVLFYFTRMPSKGRPVTESQMTPVILSEGKVIAMGRYQLKKLRRSLVL
jgi:hypothetical protein